MKSYTLAGVDLAWTPKRSTAVAVGNLSGDSLQLTEVHEALWGAAEVLDVLGSIPHLHGIAIDAPTIINNPTGQRPCETAVSRAYGSRHAGCHSSNLQNHADNAGLRVSSELQQQGYRYLASRTSRWQIECYPHPALIEFFELPERLVYKEGKNLRADDQRRGQKELARLIKKLERSPVLRLAIPNPLKRDYFSPSHIARKKGTSLKANEDVLDAVACLYIAGRYQQGQKNRVFGNTESGFIYVPEGSCI